MKNNLFKCNSTTFDQEKIPLKITFILTFNCNLACTYCNPQNHVNGIISLEKASAAIENFAKLGTKQINFIGGEPMLHKGLPTLMKLAKSYGMSTVMHSNLTLLKEENSELLKNLDCVYACINGPQDINDQIRGEGAYETTIKGINILKKNNIKVIVDYIITNINNQPSHIDHVMQLAENMDLTVGFQPVFNHELAKIDYQELKTKNLFLEFDEIKTIFEYIQNNYLHSKALQNSELYITNMAKLGHIVPSECHMGNYAYLVDAKGNVARCYKYLLDLHNNHNGFNVGWETAITKTESKVCDKCFYSTHIEDTYAINQFKQKTEQTENNSCQIN